MKTTLHHYRPNERGVALIIVLLMLALLVMLAIAVFSVSDNNLRGARVYAGGVQSRQLSDTAVDLAISQIRQGTAQDPANEGTEVWTSQPGLIRKYHTTGSLLHAFKLYSSRQMVEDSTVGLLADVPPSDWASRPNRYVDLNRPAFALDKAGRSSLRFPIIDPRAMTSGVNGVQGFSYSSQYSNGRSIDGVVRTGGDAQRLPMPVEWIYVLKDGTLGAATAAGKFAGPVAPTAENPIVGRVAFWTDDESSKVNINTASEPTLWALPSFYHETDASWSRYQPVSGEFQRYPGHPATTALSPILFPGLALTWSNYEDIYNIVPKIGPGGTRAGTVSYTDDTIARIQLAQFRGEHLYATLDELWLKDDRTPNRLAGVPLSEEDVRRKAFFLTAHSRSPELNLFGRPKIATWPTSYRGPEYQTSFDRLIAYCSTLRTPAGKRPYIFQRGWADSTTADINRPENKELLTYLINQFSLAMPGFSPTGSVNLYSKYGNDLPQIVVEMFDYIRSINLHDGNLIKPGDKITPDNTTQNYMLGYAPSSARSVSFKTFTDPRFFAVDPDDDSGLKELLGFPGHGQVTPSRVTFNNEEYEGIARFPTISEVGLQFIANADNTDDADNPFPSVYPLVGKPGGARALKISAAGKAKGALAPDDYWYSNFPPQPKPNPARKEAADLSKYPLTDGFPYGKDENHPGYKRENWNHQLVANTPLKPGFRRVQAKLLLEFFIPAEGYTIIEPEISVKVSGLSKFKLNGKQLFPNDSETFRTGRRATHPGAQMDGGYGTGLKGLLRGREAPARVPMPADNNWGKDEWEVKPTALPSDSLSVLNYDLLSSYIDIDVGRDGKGTMEISEAPLTLEVYSGHLGRLYSKEESPPDEKLPSLAQTLNVTFPRNVVKAPTLVRNPILEKNNQPAVEAPSWWTFHSRGCVGIDNFDSITNRDKLGPLPYAGAGNTELQKRLRGRHFNHNVQPRIGNEPRRGAIFYGFDSAEPASAPRLFRPQQSTANTQAKIEQAEEDEGSDVVQSMVIKHGDFRLTAAQPVVDASQWATSRYWGRHRLAHTFTNFVADQMPGYDYGGDDDLKDRLVANSDTAKYPNTRLPKLPYSDDGRKAQRYGDFDNGQGPSRDGPYINKPDEGNLRSANGLAYFVDANNHASVGETFFNPNRLVPSPVMFGSLPTGVKSNDPWRTLLFRPQTGHPGGDSPPDHVFLEFFWMPVVEPYAISEPFSTAGKVNLNYQIFPFTNIHRATGLHSILKGEFVTAVPNEDLANYKVWPEPGDDSKFWTNAEGKRWHLPVDVDKTLAQFEARFSRGDAFISPSQICDVHLVPADPDTSAETMDDFWSKHRPTGDNTRERPYSRIYPRVATRSNVFRVHYIAQSIKQPRSAARDEIDDAMFQVESEQRGSALIERFVDPQTDSLPDFATEPSAPSIDNYYQIRVIESKRFGS